MTAGLRPSESPFENRRWAASTREAPLPRGGHLGAGGLHLYGFDDNPLNEWLAPWLSTIRVPYKAFAATAAQLMEADESGRGQEVMLPYDLVIRA